MAINAYLIFLIFLAPAEKTSMQKCEKYLLWGRNSPSHKVIASKLLVIHGMILIALHLREHNETDLQIYPGALFLQYWVGKL